MSEEKKCGYVSIIGRPNVGKSTLLNHILGQKISITSRKPQTTREQILGIKTVEDVQTIYVDTPGLNRKAKSALNKFMNKTASSTINGVDVIVFVVDVSDDDPEDEWVLNKLSTVTVPIILVLNKVDRIKDKKALLPLLEMWSKRGNFAAVVPVSAKTTDNLENLEKTIASYLPVAEHQFGSDEITNRSERFLASEIVREKIMRLTGQELPYAVAIEIEEYAETEKLIRIGCLILVEKPNQKIILIGKDGERLKEIGTQARLDLQRMFDKKVFLGLWVKVRQGWSDDERALKSLGYQD
jgi:GTP-binding protein Era